MAIAAADLTKIWSADTVERLRKPLVWNQITTQRRTEPWVQGANRVDIPKPDWAYNSTDSEGINVVSRTRDQAWGTTLGIDNDIVQFQTSGRYEAANRIPYEDELELPWNAVEETRQEQIAGMEDYLDQTIVTAIEGYPSVSVHGGNGFGTAGTNFIAPNGTITGTGASLPKAAMDAIAARALGLNWYTNRRFKDPGERWALLHPTIYNIFLTYLIEQKYSWDALTENGLLRNAMPGGDGEGLMAFNYRGFRCYASPAVNAASSTQADRWTITAGLRAAVAANVRPPLVQFFSPAENQTTAPGWLIRQRGFYGIAEITDGFLLNAEIEQN